MNAMRPLPPLFISHGSPMTALHPGDAGIAMQAMGRRLLARFGKPRAVLGVSAHTLARDWTLLAAPQHEAVYDFGGFDPRLRTLRYDVAGAPDLASPVQALLQAAGLSVEIDAAGGLDHGLWTPLRYLFPEADVPVLPLAWNPEASPAELMAAGRALAPLAEDGVLILASGSITHNLRLFMQRGAPMNAPEMPESEAFRHWWAERAAERDWPALQAWAHEAPHGMLMHPTDEHLLPWFLAAGAGGAESPAVRVHGSAQHAVIGMDLYVFGPNAAALA